MHVALSVTGATGCILYWVTVEAFVRLSGEPAKYVRSDAREGGGWVVWERRKRILHCCRELVLPEFGLQESYCLFRHFSSKFRQKSGIANACNFLCWFLECGEKCNAWNLSFHLFTLLACSLRPKILIPKIVCRFISSSRRNNQFKTKSFSTVYQALQMKFCLKFRLIFKKKTSGKKFHSTLFIIKAGYVKGSFTPYRRILVYNHPLCSTLFAVNSIYFDSPTSMYWFPRVTRSSVQTKEKRIK